MNFAFFLRDHLTKVPYSIGKQLSYVPFSVRPGIGKSYSKSKKSIEEFNKKSIDLKKDFLFQEMRKITTYAYNEIPFYKEYYNSLKFSPVKHLKNFDDISCIPILKKEILMHFDIEKRSNFQIASKKVNTGGTSGTPLTFLIPVSKMGIEWSHLHYIWHQQMAFKPNQLKMLIVGRSDVRDKLEYDFIRHSLRVDLYSSFDEISIKILLNYAHKPIYFIHGYPSAIYELALYCKSDLNLLKLIQKNLKGIILNSEYPNDFHRDIMESVFEVKTFSFYGHTEGCVIAYESERNIYHPMHTYGYVESELCNGNHNLIGTNYYNYASPMIRYNTEDIIYNAENEQSLLSSFSIKEGRPEEFVLDKKNKKIPLTGLIFGRHHKLFDYCSHIQAQQIKNGNLKLFYVLLKKEKISASDLFDSSNIEMDFEFEELSTPIRTVSGKVKLLV